MSSHVTSGRWRFGLTLSFVTVLLWAVLPLALKVVLKQMDAFTITWYRFLAAAVVLAFPVLRSRGLAPLRGLNARSWILVVVSAVGLCGNYIFYLIGLDHITPSTAQVLIQLAPMFMLVGGLIIFHERFTVWQRAGVLVLLIGLGVFFNRELLTLFTAGSARTVGIMFILAAAVTWAAYALAQKQLLRDMSSISIMFLIYVTGSILFLPLAEPSSLLRLDSTAAWLLAFCAFNTLAAYGAFAEALDHLEASRVSVVLATTPLLTVTAVFAGSRLIPSIVEADDLGALALLGAAMVVTGSVLGALGRARRAPSGRAKPAPRCV